MKVTHMKHKLSKTTIVIHDFSTAKNNSDNDNNKISLNLYLLDTIHIEFYL